MAFVADFSALSAAAEAVGEAASPTFENVLIDMFIPGPSKTAGVIAANNV